MEKERSHVGPRPLTTPEYMDVAQGSVTPSYVIGERSLGGFSAIRVTATLSVLILIGVAGWQAHTLISGNTVTFDSTLEATSSTETAHEANLPTTSTVGSSAIGAAVLGELVSRYTTLQEKGIYTPEMGQKVAQDMATTLMPEVPFTHHSASEITTDPATSADRALTYRHDLQGSLAPLLKNTQAEFEIFAYYTDTKDPKYLMQLREAASNYRAAAAATSHVVVPKDAIKEHLAILNALEQFAATLDAQVTSAQDPLASLALLRTYNQAEANMYSSFKDLTTYLRQKST